MRVALRGPAFFMEKAMRLAPWLALPIFGFLILGVYVWHYGRARSLLQKWAEENGFRILASEFRHFRKGPFFWTSSEHQQVFRVQVEDSKGRVLDGWVRCGSFCWGLLSDSVEARWDEGSPEHVAKKPTRQRDDDWS